jgi:hypothetical protein
VNVARVCFLVTLACLWPGWARADPPHRVRVTIISDAAGVEPLVRERLGALHVDVEIAVAPSLDLRAALTPRSDKPALARVFVDMTGADALLVIVDGEWERALVRRIPKDRGDEVAREQVGLVLASVVEALLDGGKVGIERTRVMETVARPEPPPVRESTPKPPLPSTRIAVDLRAGYEVALFSSSVPVVDGPVASLGVRVVTPTGLAFGARLLGQIRRPFEVDATYVGAEISPIATRALASVEQKLTRSLYWSPQLGVGLDATHITPFLIAPGGQPAADRWRVDGILRAGVGLVVHTAVSFALAAIVDVDIADWSYVVTRPTGDVTVLRPYPLRPGIALEIGTP